MKLARIGIVVAIVAVALLAGTPAMADPPPNNPNASILTFSCNRGSEAKTFPTVTISQNNGLASQLVDGTGMIVTVHAEFNGQVVFDIPGQSGRSDLWSCTIAEFPPELSYWPS